MLPLRTSSRARSLSRSPVSRVAAVALRLQTVIFILTGILFFQAGVYLSLTGTRPHNHPQPLGGDISSSYDFDALRGTSDDSKPFPNDGEKAAQLSGISKNSESENDVSLSVNAPLSCSATADQDVNGLVLFLSSFEAAVLETDRLTGEGVLPPRVTSPLRHLPVKANGRRRARSNGKNNSLLSLLLASRDASTQRTPTLVLRQPCAREVVNGLLNAGASVDAAEWLSLTVAAQDGEKTPSELRQGRLTPASLHTRTVKVEDDQLVYVGLEELPDGKAQDELRTWLLMTGDQPQHSWSRVASALSSVQLHCGKVALVVNIAYTTDSVLWTALPSGQSSASSSGAWRQLIATAPYEWHLMVRSLLHSQQQLFKPFVACDAQAAAQFYALHERPTDAKSGRFRDLATSLLQQVSFALTVAGVPFWLSSGTVLGWYRQCEFIPYSEDVDIGIFADQYDPAIVPALESVGLKLTHRFGTRGDGFELSFKNQAGLKVDVFFFYRQDRKAYWNGGTQARTGRKFKYSFQPFGHCWTSFAGTEVQVPCPTRPYVEANYGLSWQTPVTSWDWKTSPPNVEPNGQWPEHMWPEVIQCDVCPTKVDPFKLP